MKIVFLNYTMARIWPTMMDDRGVGGSDAAIIQISKEFARMGHEVELHGNTPRAGMYDGVRWVNETPREEVCDVLVVNRARWHYDKFKPKKMIYWTHDDIDAPVNRKLSEFVNKPDRIVCLSEYHKFRLMGIGAPEKNIRIVGEGIQDLPKWNPQKIPRSACYASAPFKGLHVLMRLWPRLKEEIPGITLNLCTGMELHGEKLADKYFQKMYDAALLDPQVNYCGMLTNREVRLVMAKSELLLYPNTFAETFCTTAYEAMKERTPVLTSLLGALPQVVGPCGRYIRGDPKSREYQDSMVTEARRLLVDKRDELADLQRACANAKIYTWKERAEQMMNIIEGIT